MAVNWQLGQMPDIGMNALAAFNQGREQRQQDDARAAFTNYAANPDENGLNALAQYSPEFVIRERGRLQEQQAGQQKAQREQMLVMGKLLGHATDPVTYQQARQAAQQYGMDLSEVPEQFDPAWVSQQKMLVDAFNEDGGEKISGIARELVDAGFQPGTPEFAEAMRGVINNKYATEYVDEAGNTRRRSALNLPGSPPPSGPQPGAIEDGYRFKGGNPADPNAWEQVAQGGPQPPAAGGFRP